MSEPASMTYSMYGGPDKIAALRIACEMHDLLFRLRACETYFGVNEVYIRHIVFNSEIAAADRVSAVALGIGMTVVVEDGG